MRIKRERNKRTRNHITIIGACNRTLEGCAYRVFPHGNNPKALRFGIANPTIDVQIGPARGDLGAIQERHAGRVAEDDGGVVDVGTTPSVAIALAADALLVDLVAAGVGLAGEGSGGDGHGQGEAIELVLHEIHPLRFYCQIGRASCSRWRRALALPFSRNPTGVSTPNARFNAAIANTLVVRPFD